MRIGEVAQRVGLRASALRFYEAQGLLPTPERVSGRRVYGEAILDRLAFIQFAQACGFSLEDVAILLGMGPASSGRSSERLRTLAARKIREIDEQISRAQGMKVLLEGATGCECVTADQCGKMIRREAAGLESISPMTEGGGKSSPAREIRRGTRRPDAWGPGGVLSPPFPASSEPRGRQPTKREGRSTGPGFP